LERVTTWAGFKGDGLRVLAIGVRYWGGMEKCEKKFLVGEINPFEVKSRK